MWDESSIYQNPDLLDNQDPHGSGNTNEESSQSSELDDFRVQWLQELQQQLRLSTSSYSFNDVTLSSNQRSLKGKNDKVTIARTLYQIGINEERAGNPFKAVNFYAKACRLFPEIEKEFNSYHDSPDRSVESGSKTETPSIYSEDEDFDLSGLKISSRPSSGNSSVSSIRVSKTRTTKSAKSTGSGASSSKRLYAFNDIN